jgi:hypothetical protein
MAEALLRNATSGRFRARDVAKGAGVRAVAVGLLLEEQRGEIVSGWRRDVEHELGGEPALAFAVGPLLREMSVALRGDPSPLRPGIAVDAGGARSAVLVRSGAASARLAREFKLLHRAIWDALKRASATVGADERRAADEWLDEALAAALDRQDRLRTRADLLDASPGPAGSARPHGARPPSWQPDVEPVPAAPPPSRTPPPLPARVSSSAPPRDRPPVVIPARPHPAPRSPRPPPLPVAETDFSTVE